MSKDTQRGHDHTQLRVEKATVKYPIDYTQDAVYKERVIEGVILECADGRAGDFEAWMLTTLGIMEREYMEKGVVTRAIDAKKMRHAIARILKEANRE